MSVFKGTKLTAALFGESHGEGVGIAVDGLPAGETVDFEELKAFAARRAPGRGDGVTKRKEADETEVLSGMLEGRTTGAPLALFIRNTDTRSADYAGLSRLPRPSHADYAAHIKYGGNNDIRGGGHFSARLTAPLCAAGGIALQILARRGVSVCARLLSVGSVSDFAPFESPGDFAHIKAGGFPVLSRGAEDAFRAEIESARTEADSVGGIVECVVFGLPAGLGGPLFGGIEGKLSHALYGIPAVKGVEFGGGFALAAMRGSDANDAFTVKEGEAVTATNRSGGIQGGITNGMPVVFRAAFKPTPSIGKKQRTVDLQSGEEHDLVIKGRHDPCVALRAVPVVEAVSALAALDLVL